MAYNQISPTGSILPGPDPKGPTPEEIKDIIYNALNQNDFTFQWIEKSSQPYSGKLFTGETELDLFIYAWRIGNGGRSNLPSEKRIQIPNDVNNIGFNRPITATEKTLLLGIYDSPSGDPIFAAWDAVSNRTHTQKSCQVKVEDLAKAITEKIYQTFDTKGNTIYTFQCDYLGDYIDLLRSNNSLDIDPSFGATSTLKDKVKKSTMPHKKKRTIKSINDILIKINELSETEKDSICKQRIGQGLFKDLLRDKYNCKCALCDISTENMLIGSHIKEWTSSNDTEKLDVNNGLLLCAHHDALFDKHLISFQDDGSLIVSPLITPAESTNLRLTEIKKLTVTAEMKPYLAYHRNKLKK